MQSTIPVLGLCFNRVKQLIEMDPVEHLSPNAVDHSEGHLGSVLRRIDVHPKRALAEWRIDNLHDGFRNRANVSIVGHDRGEGLLDFLTVAFIRSCFVLRQTRFVGRHAGMGEVVGAPGKRSRHNNRGFDAPQHQFARV
jgi:hypothetical protein